MEAHISRIEKVLLIHQHHLLIITAFSNLFVDLIIIGMASMYWEYPQMVILDF